MKSIILLHGALGSKVQFDNLQGELESNFDVHSFNFEGHGGRNLKGEFGIQLFSENLKDYITDHNLNKPIIFGYSMGGYVALNVASQQVDLFERIITLGTKFDWNPDTALKESRMLNPEIIVEKVPAFAKYLEKIHSPTDWSGMMNNTARMMVELGNNPLLRDFEQIQIPVHLNLGDQDNMVSQEETRKVHGVLNNSSFEIIDECPHPINQIPNEVLLGVIESSLT